MDESWRMRMGPMPGLPRRRSAEHASTRSIFAAAAAKDSHMTLDPDDFADVFGGPPRSVLPRQLSRGSTHFYEEIFRPPYFCSTAKNSGPSLPAFRTPARNEGFYCDIFGSDNDGRQRKSRERSRPNSKAKSNSSSVLSSGELSPLRPVIGDDVAFSSFASKLRPLNVPCRWNSSTMKPTKEHPKKQSTSALHCNPLSFAENQVVEKLYDEKFRSSNNFGYTRKVSSPETISSGPNSCRSVKLPVDDLELPSPSSAVSSLCQEHEIKSGIWDRVLREKEVGVLEQEEEEEEEEEDAEVMSSYVIEINSDQRREEAVGIEEAIAWAKEKFQTHCNSKKEGSLTPEDNHQSVEMDEGRPNVDEYSDHQQRDELQLHLTQSPEEEEERTWITEDEKKPSEKDLELELLDEDIRLWSSGKESNIRMLLSTLHHIVWPNSGWCAIPLTSLIESSQVKKAYQKARLCLHPDKLQQRGATSAQKYIAEKAFTILQDAWAVFISKDVFII